MVWDKLLLQRKERILLMLMLVGFAMVLMGFSELNVSLLCWDSEGQLNIMWFGFVAAIYLVT